MPVANPNDDPSGQGNYLGPQQPAPAPGKPPGADGTVENGGIWYHGTWYSSPSSLKALGWSDADWQVFLRSDNRYGDWVASFGGSAPVTGKPDGTLDNGGVWYHGKLYSADNRLSLRSAFSSDDAWREWLNSNPAVRDWWNAAGGGGTYTTAGGGAGSTTHTNTGTGAGGAEDTIDWEAVLGEYGLPADVIAQLNLIWKAAAGDVNKAVTIATAYIRGTDWYKATYPGIQKGINAGLFNDERGYRAYHNQVDQIFTQYYGRAATLSELAGFITKGQSIGQIASQFQSKAAQGNISDPLKVLFTPDELKAMTDEQAGIDTALGQSILKKANLAVSVGQLYQSFYGRPITRAELDTLTAQGLDASAVARQFATEGNLNAMNPAIRGLFTPDELHEMALQAAGGETQHGQALTEMALLAAQLNQVYLTYHGTAVSRDELNQAYASGYTAQQVANILQTKSVLGSLPSFMGGLFTPEQLNLISQQSSGQSDTSEGRRLLTLAQSADSFNAVFQVYMGRNVSLSELSQYVNQGLSPTQVGNQLQAGNFAGGLPAGVVSMFSPEQLASAAGQSSGAAQSAQGARWLSIVQGAGAYHAAATQYGATLTSDQLGQFYDQGVSPNAYAQKLQGSAYASAYGPQIQQTVGSFGEGQLTPDQLQTFGAETAGLDTPEGQRLMAAYQKAQTRMNGVFKGTLASPTGFGRALTRQGIDNPDVAA